MVAGSPAASSCARRISSRTPCIDTRAKVSVTVVSAPTTSYWPARRTSWSENAESLPLDQAIRALGVMHGTRCSQTCSGVRGVIQREKTPAAPLLDHLVGDGEQRRWQ